MNSIEPLLLALWKDLQDVRVLSQIGVIAASLPCGSNSKLTGLRYPIRSGKCACFRNATCLLDRPDSRPRKIPLIFAFETCR